MNYVEFKKSMSSNSPPDQLSPALRSLWHDGKGEWDKAHTIADREGGADCDWVHAYLHRKEGDHWNAGYWYRRAGKIMPEMTLQEEWDWLVRYLLESTKN